MKLTPIIAGLVLTGVAIPPAQSVVSADVPAITRRLDGLAAFGATGAVLLLQRDTVILARGFGLADRAGAIPVSTGTPFKLGSLSKQFTPTAILTLEIAGRLK